MKRVQSAHTAVRGRHQVIYPMWTLPWFPASQYVAYSPHCEAPAALSILGRPQVQRRPGLTERAHMKRLLDQGSEQRNMGMMPSPEQQGDCEISRIAAAGGFAPWIAADKGPNGEGSLSEISTGSSPLWVQMRL